MARTLKHYLASHPTPQHHQRAGEKTATRRGPMSAGWAWKPDAKTEAALKRGTQKLKRAEERRLHPEEEIEKMATKKARSKKRTSTKRTKKTTAKKTAAKKVSSAKIPLKRICQELDIEPRDARRKLRAAGLSGHDPKARWEFTPTQAKKAKEVLAA